MIMPRSTYYDTPAEPVGDAELLSRMQTICDEFEAYGYRRVGAALRHQGIIVNAKKIRRLMREHDLQPKRRRRYVTTTDSVHDNPIFPDRARGMIVDGANQLWVADLTYIAIATGFVYLAAILDAWSRRVVFRPGGPGGRPANPSGDGWGPSARVLCYAFDAAAHGTTEASWRFHTCLCRACARDTGAT
jgi:hypothetical protein